MAITKDAYESYLRDISRFKRISYERESELSRKIRKGRSPVRIQAAIDELIHGNLFLVIHCLKDFDKFLDAPGVNITRMDLIAEGNIALMTAAKNFDSDYISVPTGRHVKFCSYACGIIRNRMRRALKMARLIHIPEQHFAYWAKMKRLESEFGTELTDDILMDRLEVGASKLKKLQESFRSRVSMLEDMVTEDGSSRWADVIASKDTVCPGEETTRRDLNSYLQTQMEKLPLRTRKMITLAYLSEKGASLGDLSRQFGVSRERCRQVLAKGLKVLRSQIEAQWDKVAVVEPMSAVTNLQGMTAA